VVEEAKHKVQLSVLCRICELPVVKPVSKHDFRNEFISISNLDVGIEDEDIYPMNICKAHTDVFFIQI